MGEGGGGVGCGSSEMKSACGCERRDKGRAHVRQWVCP